MLRPKSREFLLLDNPQTLTDEQIKHLLGEERFDGRFFHSLSPAAQEAVRVYAYRHGLLSPEQAQQLGIVIGDPSYGSALFDKIIGNIRARLCGQKLHLETDKRMAADTPISHAATSQEAVHDPEGVPSFNQADWNLFAEKMETCSDALFLNIVWGFILKKPNPYAQKIWEMAKLRGDNVKCSVAKGILYSNFIPTAQKEELWDELKQSSFLPYLAEHHDGGELGHIVFAIDSENIQRDYLDLFQVGSDS